MSEGVKVSLAMIVRNCADDLDRCLASIRDHVDEIVIANTGIGAEEAGFDETNAVAEKHGAKVIHFPWTGRFDEAREASFDACSNDIVMWLDSDDIVVDAADIRRGINEAFSRPGCDSYVIEYVYSHLEDGSRALVQTRDRVVDRRLYEWSGAVHEALCAKVAWERKVHEGPGHVWHDKVHMEPVKEKASLERNLSVYMDLYGSLDNPEISKRDLAYLGNTLFGMTKFKAAIDVYDRYLRHGSDANHAEEFLVHSNMGHSYRMLSDLVGAKRNARMMQEKYPHLPGMALETAETYFLARDFDRAAFWARRSMDLRKNAPHQTVRNEAHLFRRPEIILAICAASKGDWDTVRGLRKDIEWAEEFDENVKRALTTLDNITMRRHLETSISVLSSAIGKDRVRGALPDEVLGMPSVRSMLPDQVESPSIAILTIRGAEKWSYDCVEKGVGGSEEAVYFMSRALRGLGWNVDVFTHSETSMVVDGHGTRWFDISAWSPESKYDIVISWRSPEMLRNMGSTAKARYLWLHDTPVAKSWRPDTQSIYDGVFVLSKYHKRMFPWVDEKKLVMTSNGIDLATCVDDIDLSKKVPKRMIWPSDPSRGLQHLLPWWDTIIEKHPDAELHVFYGWSPTFMRGLRDGNPHLRDIYEVVEDHRKKQGIFWHGRVPQQKLNEFSATCSIWPYMMDFPEVYCINAVKLQAHGVWPVVPTFGAVEETARYGDILKVENAIPTKDATWLAAPPMTDPALQKEFIDLLLHRLDKGVDQAVIPEMIRWARSNTWERVAHQWDALFKEALECSSSYESISRDWEGPRECRSQLRAWKPFREARQMGAVRSSRLEISSTA